MAHYRESIKDYEILNLGDFKFQSGTTIPNAKLAYKTYGKLNNDASNAIVLVHGVNGTHESTASVHIEGEGRAISPESISLLRQICSAKAFHLPPLTHRRHLMDQISQPKRFTTTSEPSTSLSQKNWGFQS